MRVGPPPERHHRTTREIMNLLLVLEASHHVTNRKGKLSKSQMLRDVENVLDMDNGDVSGSELCHYCWGGSGGPCCADLVETKNRMKVAY